MAQKELLVFPGQKFQLNYLSLADQLQWSGSFEEVAEYALRHVKTAKHPLLPPKLIVKRLNNDRGKLEPIQTPLNAADVSLAIKAFSAGQSAQLWLMIKTELVTDHPSLNLQGVKEQIERM